VAELDLTTGLAHYTPRFAALYGMPPSPLPLPRFDEALADVLAAESLCMYFQHEEAARAGQAVAAHTYDLRTPQGPRCVRVQRVGLGPGRVLRIDSDATAERELRIRFETALAALNGVAYEWDVETDRVERIGALEPILGLDGLSWEDSGTGWRAQVHPDDLQQAEAKTNAAVAARSASVDNEYRIRNGAGGWTWVWDHALIDYRPDGALRRLFGCTINIDARKRSELALEQSQTRLGLALGAARMGAWETDTVRKEAFWSPELFELLDLPPHANPVSDAELRATMHPDDEERLCASFEAALADPAVSLYRDEGRARAASGREILFETRGHILRDRAGRALLVTAVFCDVTEARRAREQIQFLMQEVNHRAKNLLSVVQAVANQAAREDGAAQGFTQRFSQRLTALAACHDLLVRNHWLAVELKELAHSQLAPYADLIGSRIRIDGPALQLTPAAAQAMAMVLHELATNAGKYGALSNGAGRVEFTWERSEASVRALWRERDGPPVPSPPARQGFGHKVMTDMVEMALGGQVRLDYPATGFEWRLEAPPGRMEKR